MGIRGFLIPPEVMAEAGTSVTFTLDLDGGDTDLGEMDLDASGVAGTWATVAPSRLPPGGGRHAQARVVVSVPRTARTAPGPRDIVIRARGAAASVEVAGIVHVRPFSQLRVAISPRAVKGRVGGEAILRIENLGNVAAAAGLVPGRSDRRLEIDLDQSSLVVAPGEEASVRVGLRARRWRLLGRPEARGFTLGVHTPNEDKADTVAEGVFWQERLRWPVPLAIAALLGTLAAGLALRPRGDEYTGVVSAGTILTTVAGAPGTACTPEAQDASGGLVVQNFLFCPATATVAAGRELRWVNLDASQHTVTADGTGFDTQGFGRGEARSVRFETPGVYAYYCRFHPFMRGTVIVTA